MRRKLYLWYSDAMLDQPPKGGDTRERLLELAEEAVLAKGFAATSIEELIAAAGITKSGFFYHFKDKGDLAKALLLRYLEHDAVLDDIFRPRRRAERRSAARLSGGPETVRRDDGEPARGASGLPRRVLRYQDQLFNREVRELTPTASWLAAALPRAHRTDRENYPPRTSVDLDALADMAATLVDGALTLARALRDPTIPPRQVMLYRDFVRSVFALSP